MTGWDALALIGIVASGGTLMFAFWWFCDFLTKRDERIKVTDDRIFQLESRSRGHAQRLDWLEGEYNKRK